MRPCFVFAHAGTITASCFMFADSEVLCISASLQDVHLCGSSAQTKLLCLL